MHFNRNDRDILSFICLICLLPSLGFTTIILEVNDIKIMSFNDAFFRPPVTVVSSLTNHNINIIICAHKNICSCLTWELLCIYSLFHWLIQFLVWGCFVVCFLACGSSRKICNLLCCGNCDEDPRYIYFEVPRIETSTIHRPIPNIFAHFFTELFLKGY